MLVIAVTGGIASGKSTVAHVFNTQYQIPIIDSDHIAKDLVNKNQEIINKLIKKFGQNIIDPKNNQLDRKKLRAIIFNDPDAKKWLENLLHPIINKTLRKQVDSLKINNQHPYCLLLIPLVTKEYLANNPFINRVLVVDSPEELQITRASKRDSQSSSGIKKIIQSQLPRKERLKLADYVIINDSNLDNIKSQCIEIHQQLVTK